jgi:hypothetical protein
MPTTNSFTEKLTPGGKKIIQRLRAVNGWVFSHEDKAQEIQNFFQNAMKQPPLRNVDLN